MADLLAAQFTSVKECQDEIARLDSIIQIKDAKAKADAVLLEISDCLVKVKAIQKIFGNPIWNGFVNELEKSPESFLLRKKEGVENEMKSLESEVKDG